MLMMMMMNLRWQRAQTATMTLAYMPATDEVGWRSGEPFTAVCVVVVVVGWACILTCINPKQYQGLGDGAAGRASFWQAGPGWRLAGVCTLSSGRSLSNAICIHLQCLQDCVKGALGVHQLQLQCLRSAALKHTAKSL